MKITLEFEHSCELIDLLEKLESNIKQDKAECTTTHLYESQDEILDDLRNLENSSTT